MNITVFGSGYVGLVTGACLSEMGNNVLCVDVDEKKIDMLKAGKVPIFEPGLDKMIAKNITEGRIDFTTDAKEGVAHGEIQFIAVGTPPDEDGSADLQYVLAVAETIGKNMNEYKVIVDKSTVPVGTADKVRAKVEETLAIRKKKIDFDIVSNPEFLKEGDALSDFMKPDRIVVGVSSKKAEEKMREVYAPFNRNRERLIVMDVRSAELTKYAANSLLATKISFMNELSNLAEKMGADIEEVRRGIGSDSRIGHAFIYPGCGYGGSCFPKDVKALIRTARSENYDTKILEAVEAVNDAQKHILFEKITKHFEGNLKGKTFALWGLAFKPNTDDMREAPSRVLLSELWAAGAQVQAYDPVASEEANRIYGKRDDLTLCKTDEEALTGADALIIVTEWQAFRSPDFSEMKSLLKEPLIFDGRNMYEPKKLKEEGFTYYSIGRK